MSHGRRYKIEIAGKWIQPVRQGYKTRCCDCGLVHTMDVRIYRGRVQFRVWRDERATSQIRRHMRKGQP